MSRDNFLNDISTIIIENLHDKKGNIEHTVNIIVFSILNEIDNNYRLYDRKGNNIAGCLHDNFNINYCDILYANLPVEKKINSKNSRCY